MNRHGTTWHERDQAVTRVPRIQSEMWFVGDDQNEAQVHAEATDDNEIAIYTAPTQDWKDIPPQTSLYLPALEAIRLAAQIDEAARRSLEGWADLKRAANA